MALQTAAPKDCIHLIDDSHVKDFEVAEWIKISLASIYCIIFVAGVLGNSVTIQTTKILQKKGYLQKAVTDHMVSLACSDLLVIFLGMPVEFYSMIWNPFSTPKGDLACKLYTFLFETCSYATVLHVATLSFERYIAVCYPFKFKATSGPCKVKILIAFVWITSVLVALPLLFAMGAEHPLAAVPGHQGLVVCEKPKARHHLPEFRLNVTICTNLSSKWKVFQFSIFTAFIVYIIVLVSVAFMCRNMMKVLMVYKQPTLPVGRGEEHQRQYLRKTENPEARRSKKQTILFLGKVIIGGPPIDECGMKWNLGGSRTMAVTKQERNGREKIALERKCWLNSVLSFYIRDPFFFVMEKKSAVQKASGTQIAWN